MDASMAQGEQNWSGVQETTSNGEGGWYGESNMETYLLCGQRISNGNFLCDSGNIDWGSHHDFFYIYIHMYVYIYIKLNHFVVHLK